MSLLRFWPTEQNILDCIKPEAENPLDAVFLAVHQPMKLKRRQFDSDREQDGNEHDLLRYFLKSDLPTGTLLVPLLGDSGTGKSHLVRWLDVQLRQRSDRAKRHVIRIPKSSSLKTVLRRILEGLQGPRYDAIRRQLQSAREQMDHIQATERIRAELLTAIRRRTDLAMQRKAYARQTGAAVDPNDDRWIGHGDRRYLPALLSDPITSRMFMERYGERAGIVVELARHLTEDSTVDHAPRRQFEDADFAIPDDLQSEVASEAGVPARRYLQRLEQSNGQARREAVLLLNEIIDDAVAPLATPADTSLSELFYAVRRELLTEGRELVLLVEDFAVLAGIQGALLDAMIREGVRGTQDACVMRTALAVTKGYFTSFETVRTRAVHAWYIDEVPDDSEEDTINRMCDFIGAYLNAARFGADGLATYCRADSHDHSWVPDFVDNETLKDAESRQLGSFGQSPNGRALFPLNRNAIVAIAEWRMRDVDRRLKFNPRKIITDLLIPVLREYRQHFERGEFPPELFLSYDPNTLEPDVRSQIRDRIRNPQEQRRLFAMLRFWGGNPRDVSRVHLDEAAYEAFGLPVIAGLPSGGESERRKEPPPEQPRDPHSRPTPQPETRVAPQPQPEPQPEPPEIRAWLDRLEKWSHGQDLIQRDANQLRSMIADAVLATVHWEGELLRKLSTAETNYLNEWVYLPSAKGASHCNPSNAFVAVGTQEQFNTPDTQERIILGLRAMIRFHHYKTWSFERSDEDFPRYANLVHSLQKQAVCWLKSSYRKVDGDPVPALVEALLIGGRMLNIPAAHGREDASLIDAMFTVPDEGPVEDESSWAQLRKQCFECRSHFVTELLSRTGVRQGEGKQVFAVDASRLLESARTLKSDWQIKSPFPKHRSADESITRIEAHVKDLTRRLQSAIAKRREEILTQWKGIRAALGDDFDKQEIVGNVSKVIQATRQFGVKDQQDNLSQLAGLVERFRDGAVSKCLQHIQRIGDESEGGAVLSALAQVDDGTFQVVSDFVREICGFLDRTEKQIKGELAVLGDNIVENAIDGLDTKLKTIEEAMPRPKGVGQ